MDNNVQSNVNNIQNNNIQNNNIQNNNIQNNNFQNNGIQANINNSIQVNRNNDAQVKVEDVEFKQLSTKEQIAILENAYNTISQKIYKERNQEIINGQIEIMDISYNLTSDGQVVFDVKIMDNITKEEKHEYYNKNFEKIDIDLEKIEAYKLLGVDTKEMEAELAELQALDKSEDKVSLLKLKSMDKQVEQTAKALGLSKEEIEASATMDANQKLKIDQKLLNGNSIDAKEKISIHYNMRDVLGGNYVSYQIVKTTMGGYKLMGIDAKGFAEEIGEDKVQLVKNAQTISLTQENGTSKEASLVVGFRVKSKASDVDNDQIVGLCDDGKSSMTTFYGRGAIYQDQIVAENIPNKTYNGYRVKQERFMDTLETDKNEFTLTNEIINESAEEHNIDPETLRSEVMKKYNDFDNVTLEEVNEMASDLERTEPPEPEHSLDNHIPNSNP